MESHNFLSIHLAVKNKKLPDRLSYFKEVMSKLTLTYKRTILTAAGREITIKDPFTGMDRPMLMFASNNYLNLATHPHVINRVKKAIDEFGVGIGGPPLLNGYTHLIKETEERLAAFKNHESAITFSSGFLTNLGLVSVLAEHNDTIIYDELCHASLHDGLKLSKAKSVSFPHNNIETLHVLLKQNTAGNNGSVYVFIEGVYSMDGDLAPLDLICNICEETGAILVVDDAHGTGVIGENGRGTAAFFNCENKIQISMGTFSKVFATCGGFVTASNDLIEYLRYNARTYMFSASIPPTVAATVLGGIEVLEKEPWLRQQLLENVQYAIEKLKPFGFSATPQAAIIALKLPPNMDIRKSSLSFHEKGIFINTIEFPVVPTSRERFRISIMSDHTKEDIDRLATVVEEVWNAPDLYI